MLLKWPRGKYNGERIAGFSLKFTFTADGFYWRPMVGWGYGHPYFIWLFLRVHFEPKYMRDIPDF